MDRSAALVEATKLAIACHLDRNISVTELAREMRCTTWRLCRAFRRITGQTLTSYRHALRVQVALERLRERPSDLTDLALELGYSSHSHFTHVFRRHMGITPSEVRAIELKKELPRPVPPEARQTAV
ncbi:MAG TPA: helix-turn-helix transcriptional regulator [Thermoanaerobaculia bacterium]|nr:helix-turn-helix transcriptional regulator [Thermoanaerobaculia bacterium]